MPDSNAHKWIIETTMPCAKMVCFCHRNILAPSTFSQPYFHLSVGLSQNFREFGPNNKGTETLINYIEVATTVIIHPYIYAEVKCGQGPQLADCMYCICCPLPLGCRVNSLCQLPQFDFFRLWWEILHNLSLVKKSNRCCVLWIMLVYEGCGIWVFQKKFVCMDTAMYISW